MKAMLHTLMHTTSKLFALLAIVSSAIAAEPNESGAGKPCGVLKNFDGEVQIFDYTRTHLSDAAFGAKVHCGDWVSVETGKATIEHLGGAAFLVAGNTFFQVLDPQSGENPEHAHVALYRGEFVAHSQAAEIRVLTPNAVARVTKGGAFVLYSSEGEESQLVGLGATASLENRYFSERKMTTAFAKVVSFANPVERLVPDEARFVNAVDLNARLARLGVETSVQATIERTVKAGAKTRLPVTLASTAVRVEMGGEMHTGAQRAPASVPEHMPKKVATRAPASAVSKKHVARDEPNFALRRGNEEVVEKKKLLQALSSLRAEDE